MVASEYSPRPPSRAKIIRALRLTSKKHNILRVGKTIEIFEFIFKFIFNLFVFLTKKSCHSNLTGTFIVDYVRPNGFQDHIDQARNCPFRLSDDRWRHVRWRNGLLHNCENCQTGKPFYEKGMNGEMIRIAPTPSLMSLLINGQANLT